VLFPVHAKALPYRVGVITETPGVRQRVVEGLREGLHSLGFVEGPDVVYDMHFTRGRREAAAAAVDALAKAGANVIFTSGEGVAVAAKTATQRIPVVFTQVGDPVTAGPLPLFPTREATSPDSGSHPTWLPSDSKSSRPWCPACAASGSYTTAVTLHGFCGARKPVWPGKRPGLSRCFAR
jgi:hypothetical protein